MPSALVGRPLVGRRAERALVGRRAERALGRTERALCRAGAVGVPSMAPGAERAPGVSRHSAKQATLCCGGHCDTGGQSTNS